MPTHTTSDKPNIFPVLKYQNAPAAIAWLSKALGFDKMMEVPGPDGTIAHAEMSLGQGVIMIGSARKDPTNPWSTIKQGIYVYVDDVDAHHDRAKAAGAEIISAPRDTEYGSREYGVRDPEGNLWGFGSFLPETNTEA